jgi:hypothetical protein
MDNSIVVTHQACAEESFVAVRGSQRMLLPDGVPNRDDMLKRIVEINVVLAPNIPREAIDGWNSYLIALKQITKPIAYDDLVWKTGRP